MPNQLPGIIENLHGHSIANINKASLGYFNFSSIGEIPLKSYPIPIRAIISVSEFAVPWSIERLHITFARYFDHFMCAGIIGRSDCYGIYIRPGITIIIALHKICGYCFAVEGVVSPEKENNAPIFGQSAVHIPVVPLILKNCV